VRQRSTGSVVDTLGEGNATGSGSSRSSEATTSRRAAQNELGSTMVARSGRRHRSDRLRKPQRRRRLGWPPTLPSPDTRAHAGCRISRWSSSCRSAELMSVAGTSKPQSRHRLSWPPLELMSVAESRAGPPFTGQRARRLQG
jgi:hypothetical protein